MKHLLFNFLIILALSVSNAFGNVEVSNCRKIINKFMTIFKITETNPEISDHLKTFQSLGYSKVEINHIDDLKTFNLFRVDELKPVQSTEGRAQRREMLADYLLDLELAQNFFLFDFKQEGRGNIIFPAQVIETTKSNQDKIYLVRTIHPKTNSEIYLMMTKKQLLAMKPRGTTEENATLKFNKILSGELEVFENKLPGMDVLEGSVDQGEFSKYFQNDGVNNFEEINLKSFISGEEEYAQGLKAKNEFRKKTGTMYKITKTPGNQSKIGISGEVLISKFYNSNYFEVVVADTYGVRKARTLELIKKDFFEGSGKYLVKIYDDSRKSFIETYYTLPEFEKMRPVELSFSKGEVLRYKNEFIKESAE